MTIKKVFFNDPKVRKIAGDANHFIFEEVKKTFPELEGRERAYRVLAAVDVLHKATLKGFADAGIVVGVGASNEAAEKEADARMKSIKGHAKK